MPLPTPVMIGNTIFAKSSHVPGHPLAIPRSGLAIELCRSLRWLADEAYRDVGPASFEQLTRFHTPEYVTAVIEAETSGTATGQAAREFNLGVNGHQVHAHFFRRPATACGGTLFAASRVLDGGIAFNPAGGTHHGQANRASGYCIFNDPVLGILRLLDDGCARVFYLDLDAHFGDGVQQAFHDDDRVFTLSIHENGRWPMPRHGRTGFGSLDDRAGGQALNLPVPAGFNDSELDFLIADVVVPALELFVPDALVMQCGCDGLADDPMARLCLSNGAYWKTVRTIVQCVPRVVLLGGGGYNPYAVGRCWAGIWAVINGFEIPEILPSKAQAILLEVQWRHRLGRDPEVRWIKTLTDPPTPGAIRDEVRRLAEFAKPRSHCVVSSGRFS